MPLERSDFNNIWVSQYTNPFKLVQLGQKKFNIDKVNEITLRASGKAIPNACLISEQLKRRVKNLYQINNISNSILEIQSQDNRTYKRTITCLEILLSRNKVNDTHYGYQPPIDFHLVEENYQDNQNQNQNQNQNNRNRQRQYRQRQYDDRNSQNQQRDLRPLSQDYKVQQDGKNFRDRDVRPQFQSEYDNNQGKSNYEPKNRGLRRNDQVGQQDLRRNDQVGQQNNQRNNRSNRQYSPNNTKQENRKQNNPRSGNERDNRRGNRNYSPENQKFVNNTQYNPRVTEQKGGRYNSAERNRDREINNDKNRKTDQSSRNQNNNQSYTQRQQSIKVQNDPNKQPVQLKQQEVRRGGSGYIRRGGPRKNNNVQGRKVEYVEKKSLVTEQEYEKNQMGDNETAQDDSDNKIAQDDDSQVKTKEQTSEITSNEVSEGQQNQQSAEVVGDPTSNN